MAVDSGMVARLRRQLSSGELILFTGAGFSLGAPAKDSMTIASVSELKQDLWRLAFPNRPEVEEESSLGDVFEVAVTRARNATRDVFERRLRVEPSRVPERYAGWFSQPWFRHYTLNVDDLDDVIATHFDLPRDLRALSGLRDAIPVVASLLSVHLNGRLADFPEGVTFSAPQYGQRLARNDTWYQTMVVDLLNHPVVFVGTLLDEPGLWQHIEFRQQRAPDSIELRPPSYLVTPQLPAAREALLKRYNIDWIQATEEEFYREALADAVVEFEQGHAALAQRFHPSRGRVLLRALSEARQDPAPNDLSMFLLGREPAWQDLTEGFAVQRQFERVLLTEVVDERAHVALITGTAGSGKSTTAMRLALAMEAAGKSVLVLDAVESVRNVAKVLAQLKPHRADVVLIDDIDVFGDHAGRLLREIAELPDAPLAIAAIRSSRLQALDLPGELTGLRVVERTVPVLDDTDIDGLVDALDRAHRLGRMTGMNAQQRRAIFREACGRQLLVAMYRATSGESLHDRVFSECNDLGGASRIAYGMAAIATAERFGVTRDELVLGISVVTGGIDHEKLRVVPDLVKRELLVSDGYILKVRHRWIAETSIESYQTNNVIGPSLKALVAALATKADPQAGGRTRESRLLRRLLNHDYLQRLTANIGTVREVYSSVEDALAWDYHYWLQRGSLEVETGDLALAENFLNAAVSKAPANDYRVSTEYAYLLLKKAASTPRAPGAVGWAEEALADLEHAMAERGREDSYPFHVYGSQGLSWARRAPLLRPAKATLVRRLMEAVEGGCRLHPRQTELRQLADDLKKEYLNVAVV